MSHDSNPTQAVGVEEKVIVVKINNFDATISHDTQLLISLKVKGEAFDFLPADHFKNRTHDGQYHWGDITYRYRLERGSAWIDGDSSQKRSAIKSFDIPGTLAAADLAPTLSESPLEIVREWLEVEGDLAVRFTISNVGKQQLEIGSLGLPTEFNSIFTGKTQTEMQAQCCLSDPYIGFDAGYLRVAPVNPQTGSASALVVTPLHGTDTPFQAYRNLKEPSFPETAYGTHTFENLYEWQVLTKAWAENEWASCKRPWHEPSSRMLEVNESLQIGVRFSIADGVRGFDNAVRRLGIPTATSVPGYILPRDLPGQLLVKASSPVKSFSSFPEGALAVREIGRGKFMVTPSDSSSTWGYVRLTISYEDGKIQTVHYFVTKPTHEAIGDMGRFLYDKAWFSDENDPFNRAPSIMTYDYEAGEIVTQDQRVWVSGLSDEGGTGAYVAAAVKQLLQPNPQEVAKLDEFANKTIWGKVQLEDYSVKKSLFFYDPEVDYSYDQNVDWSQWACWSRKDANSVDRAYSYIHPTAVFWTLYRLARAYPDLVGRTWDWYLTHAWATVCRMTEPDVLWTDMGLMGETVIGKIIDDLNREDLSEKAKLLEEKMRKRADKWKSEAVPFGSEAPWDSTGQEGVYYWAKYFKLHDLAKRTVNSVLGYMPTVPHWAWNGNARRYWDFDVAGKLRRIERQIHNYGSSLNAQVLLDAFRDGPTDPYLIQVGYGGALAPISNINQEGFPSTGFHAWPDTMKWDGSTGDYGGAFLGMALNSGTYVASIPDMGLVAYGGILTESQGKVAVTPKDAVRQRVYLGPLRLMIEIDMGQITALHFTTESVIMFVKKPHEAPPLSAAIVWLDSRSETQWRVTNADAEETRGGWKVKPDGREITIKPM
ncbi:hypothetical protein BJX62DRAFT_241396 [Aspergillus germanicus]